VAAAAQQRLLLGRWTDQHSLLLLAAAAAAAAGHLYPWGWLQNLAASQLRLLLQMHLVLPAAAAAPKQHPLALLLPALLLLCSPAHH
jgi:hypothetical protein